MGRKGAYRNHIHLAKETSCAESIATVLKKYTIIQPNLLKHETGYPSYEQLIQKVSKGLPVFGMEGVGEGHDSEGSELIYKGAPKE